MFSISGFTQESKITFNTRKMKPEESNKLIAEFMEYNLPTQDTPSWVKTRLDEPNWSVDMEYHSSWDWLMPVVKKIHKAGKEQHNSLSYLLGQALSESNIKNTYKYVVGSINEFTGNTEAAILAKDNKLIADFMEIVDHEHLEFHKDWGMIMLVVEEIENLHYDVRIELDYCTINNGEDYTETTDFGGGKLLTVYTAVVEFIKWYNNQTNKK